MNGPGRRTDEAARGRGERLSAQEWLAAFATALGVDPPSERELEVLLTLAAEAAHSSERIAAPVACWLSARAGATPDQALRLARSLRP